VIAKVVARLPGMPLEISASGGHAIGSGSSHEVSQGALVSIANGFEVIEFRIGGDGRDQVAIAIQPQGLATPDQALDGVAVQFFISAAYVNCVLASWLDLH
jgi:hypothetical protein